MPWSPRPMESLALPEVTLLSLETALNSIVGPESNMRHAADLEGIACRGVAEVSRH